MPATDSLIGEATLASAATVNLGAVATERVAITGSAAITSFGTAPNRAKQLRFTGAATLTHNATSLVLPLGAAIVTAAGDRAVVASDASGNWTLLSYTRASGQVSYSGNSTGTLIGAFLANAGGGEIGIDLAPNSNGPGVRSAQIVAYNISDSQSGLAFKVSNATAPTTAWRMDNLGALLPSANSARDIGSASFRVRATWSATLILSPGIGTARTPANNGDLTVETTSNTQLTFRLKGSDGVVRSGSLTLA